MYVLVAEDGNDERRLRSVVDSRSSGPQVEVTTRLLKYCLRERANGNVVRVIWGIQPLILALDRGTFACLSARLSVDAHSVSCLSFASLAIIKSSSRTASCYQGVVCQVLCSSPSA